MITPLSYDEMVTMCKKTIESFELWARRLIHQTLKAKYGDEYFFFKDSNGNKLFKTDFVKNISGRLNDNPKRFSRLVDAMMIEDIIYILCREDMYKFLFKEVLDISYPDGVNEVQTFLCRIKDIRNKLYHANIISYRESEQAICYSNDFIDCLKMHYQKQGLEREYNVPVFIKAQDVLGNISYRDNISDEWNIFDSFGLKFHSGDTYRIWVEVDPSFNQESYSVEWVLTKTGYNIVKKGTGTSVEFEIKNDMVGGSLSLKIQLISNKEWHQYILYDDCFSLSVYKILPPINDNY